MNCVFSLNSPTYKYLPTLVELVSNKPLPLCWTCRLPLGCVWILLALLGVVLSCQGSSRRTTKMEVWWLSCEQASYFVWQSTSILDSVWRVVLHLIVLSASNILIWRLYRPMYVRLRGFHMCLRELLVGSLFLLLLWCISWGCRILRLICIVYHQQGCNSCCGAWFALPLHRLFWFMGEVLDLWCSQWM